MSGVRKEETMNDFEQAVDHMIENVKKVAVKNSAYYRWEEKARSLTKKNRRLRLERNYISEEE